MTYKDTEKLIERYIGYETGTHESNGHTVHRFFRIDSYSIDRVAMALRNNGFTTIPTSSSYTRDFFSEKYLSEVSYCEGDFYIIQYDSIEDLVAGKKRGIKFYKEN